MLDEPFGALDAKVRKDLRRWLRKLHDDYEITSIFVTHDQEEALDVADRVVVMNEGKIEQIGTPEEVYENPNSPFVYHFLGNVNLFKGRLQGGKLRQGDFVVDAPEFLEAENKEAVGYVRPHDISIERKRSVDSVSAKINYIHLVGAAVQLKLIRRDNDEYLEVELTKEQYRNLKLKTGEEVFVKPKQLKVFIPEDYSI